MLSCLDLPTKPGMSKTIPSISVYYIPAGKLISTLVYFLLPCQRLHYLHTSREMELETAGLCNKNSTQYKSPLHCLPEECRKFRLETSESLLH